MTPKVGMKMKASPSITGLNDWIEGNVIEVENNPFTGVVIAIKDANGIIYFDQAKYFKPAN